MKRRYVLHLQLICIVEVDANGRDHPGVEQRGQDLLSYGVCDEMEMEWVPPVDKNKYPNMKKL